MKIIMLAKPPKVTTNIHYESVDKAKQVYEVLRDCYFIMKSDFFVPCTTSGLSRMIITMLEKNKNMFCIPTKSIPACGFEKVSFEKMLQDYLIENKELISKINNPQHVRSVSPVSKPVSSPAVRSVSPQKVQVSLPVAKPVSSPIVRSVSPQKVQVPPQVAKPATASAAAPSIKPVARSVSPQRVFAAPLIQTKNNIEEKQLSNLKSLISLSSSFENKSQIESIQRSISPIKFEITIEDQERLNKIIQNYQIK